MNRKCGMSVDDCGNESFFIAMKVFFIIYIQIL